MNLRTSLRIQLALSGLLACFLEVASAQPSAPPGVFDVRSFGAVANGKSKCTAAISKAIAAATQKGGGTIYFPAGTFLTGPIHLQSRITLYLEAGSVLRFSTNFDDYLPMVPSRWEGIEVTNFSPLIYARNASDIAIRGRGTLDGQGQPWWEQWAQVRSGAQSQPDRWQKEFARANPHPLVAESYNTLKEGFMRPPFIQPYSCTNVSIEGVTII